jgi:hypothetical protein
MLTKAERAAILAECEFIAERMKLAALLIEDCRLHDRDGLVQLFVIISLVYRARILEILEEVKHEAKAYGFRVVEGMDDRGRPTIEVWHNATRLR